METMVFDRGHSTYLVNSAHLIKSQTEVSADLAAAVVDPEWNVEKSSPFVQWIAGDFVEAEKPNSNTQYWTAGDLEVAEYSIRYAPLNMIHRFRTPIGFFAATKSIKLEKEHAEEGASPLKISALSGLWSHIFPFESAQVQAADDAGLLFYSMECRGSHLVCGTDESKNLHGCGEQFDYMAVDDHCEHLQKRTSVRHIVNPVFRGGAAIVPPVRPGWKAAHASVLSSAVMQEAAVFAEQNEEQYNALTKDGTDLTASAWEHLMAQVVAFS
jgi:hypothetical protein